MTNPITSNRVYLIAYTLVWIIFGIIQAGVLTIVFDTSLNYALTDTLIFVILFFLLGIVMWYPVRYMSISESGVLAAILNHMLLAAFMVFIWISGGYILLKLFISDNSVSLTFLENSLPYRAVIATLVFALLIMLYYLMVYSENLKQRISNEANLKTLVREAELSALKSQINPHFLFNALNSISSLTMKDGRAARKMIIELSDFLRYSLKYKEKEVTSLEEEIQNISRYLEIEKIRFAERLLFTLNISDGCRNLSLPSMILQPLIENAIKHGVYESIEPVEIIMDCNCDPEYLHISVSNNYDPAFSEKKGNGIGLKNISSRLRLIYGEDNLISYTGQDSVYKVILKIPVRVQS
ncbi:MAG: histidine kinase [Bacteroidales bacterium]|nr:histidine kinase [Bacteroidales bacterium]MCB8999883.1 histidine kinase [Bacteroidales bacterium]